MNDPAHRLAIPAYFAPGAGWRAMQRAAPAIALAVMNPASGPGEQRDPAYAATIAASRAAGIAVFGYVDTAYAAREIAAVQAAIARYAAWYGVTDIFFDQASIDAATLPYYVALAATVHASGDGARAILNPGAATDEAFVAVADILLTFEDTYTEYVAHYRPAAWEARYPPERFWHLIHTTPTIPQMRHAAALSAARGAGYRYITPATLPNPWGALPGRAYWNAERGT